jgi:hypothetical protein
MQRLTDIFKRHKPLTVDQAAAVKTLRRLGIKKYRIEPDGTIFTPSDIPLRGRSLSVLPDLSLVHVGGNFDCGYNDLTSLAGAPISVGGIFSCRHNLLASLENGPVVVGGTYDCDFNRLTSLSGSPVVIRGYFSCRSNHLTSLDGAPTIVHNDFLCDINKLRSLDGAPAVVHGQFSCHGNRLKTLHGAPLAVGKQFICTKNSLTSLEGVPHTEFGVISDLGIFDKTSEIPANIATPSSVNHLSAKASAPTALGTKLVPHKAP